MLRTHSDTWNYILSKKPNIGWWDYSLFHSTSDFFSAPAILDLFASNNKAGLSLPYIQNYLEVNTGDFMFQLNNLTTDTQFRFLLNADSMCNLEILNFMTFKSNDLMNHCTLLVEDMVRITEAKVDVDLLRAVFMEFHHEIGMFDIILTDEDVALYQNLSTPEVKLYYPEPFIASPSFVHEELWFIHILHYQHWLWFMFITLIMFYFITFINVVRWCNMRTRPRRETRGVSRSKCADLITATVPVSWAASIIITESVDATDYYDGFGTGEMIVGIRAYQWGWEYFYPKGIDLNYNVTPSYSAVVGNSLKYTSTESGNLKSNVLWKHYQSKKSSQITSTPSHLVLNFNDNAKILNFFNLSNVGLNNASDASAFKKIQSFSKTNPQGLYVSQSDFQSRYNKIWDLYLNETGSNSSMAYGTYRQHNLNSASSTTNGWGSLLDNRGVNKLLTHNMGMSSDSSPVSNNAAVKSSTLADMYGTGTSTFTTRSSNFPTGNQFWGSQTDHKHPSNITKNLLTNKLSSSSELLNSGWAGNAVFTGDLGISSPLLNLSEKLTNSGVSSTFKDLKSSNTQFLSSEKNIRPISALTPGRTNHNFDEAGSSFNSLLTNSLSNKSLSTPQDIFQASLNSWGNPTNVARLVEGNTSFAPVHPPAPSNNPAVNALSFDRLAKDVSPVMLQSKEEVAPTYLFNTYWNNRWGHTNPEHRYANLIKRSALINRNYIPFITDYAEYDFQNWQALELLEDAFWESSYSGYTHDDYMATTVTATQPNYFDKQETIFNNLDRIKEFKDQVSGPSTIQDEEALMSRSGTGLYLEDGIFNTNLLAPKNFEVFNSELNTDALEDSYENIKYMNYVHTRNYQHLLLNNLSNPVPMSYTGVMDAFRPDFEEKSTHTDAAPVDENLNYGNSAQHTDNSTTSGTNLSNPFKLRSSSKNAIITYNAMQKVFRARFDEGRSHSRLQDFSNSAITHPFLTAPKVPYESLLGKNRSAFFELARYNQTLTADFSDMYQVWSSLNVYFADLPFLVSMKSDPSRYLWFDWQSRWSSIEHQPSSTARYSLLGVPYSTKNLEYETSTGNTVNDSEGYLIKLSRARKNYMSNWAYTPYFYAKTSNWYKINEVASLFFQRNESVKDLRAMLYYCEHSWESKLILGGTVKLSTPSFSGVNTNNKSSWRPSAGISSFYYNSSILIDILSKREYMYRQYLIKQGISVNLPKYLVASPANPLVTEIKSAYPFINPTSFVSENSRECFYQNTNYLRFTIIKDFLELANSKLKNSTVNLSGLTDYFFFYLFGQNTSTHLGRNTELYKSQFRPMRKGVTNMIRLHATGAVAMPIEIRMHILASSRDVIHSWSIPSAGIKIDCVPGYSSHRVTIFLVSGIFWGQCMEICGRFHHWMPIIVYFMKRDLFFLWCTHFMHYSQPDKMFNMCDRQLMDHVRLVSYDKTTWVHELNNII